MCGRKGNKQTMFTECLLCLWQWASNFQTLFPLIFSIFLGSSYHLLNLSPSLYIRKLRLMRSITRPRSQSWGVTKAEFRTTCHVLPSPFFFPTMAGKLQPQLCNSCCNLCICKLVMMLKVQQEGERQKKQLLIMFILNIYVFKDFTTIHCRCAEMVPSELQMRAMKGSWVP